LGEEYRSQSSSLFIITFSPLPYGISPGTLFFLPDT
jgi:hypothetical protein